MDALNDGEHKISVATPIGWSSSVSLRLDKHTAVISPPMGHTFVEGKRNRVRLDTGETRQILINHKLSDDSYFITVMDQP